MWGLDLPRERLQAIGATLGADVPFFVFGAPALARGVGERLTAMTVPRDTWRWSCRRSRCRPRRYSRRLN